jgi:hypothetical protein
MKAKTGFLVALLFFPIPWTTHAKERGTVVDNRNASLLLPRELRANLPTEDTLTFTLDKDHYDALVIAGSAKKIRLLLIAQY